MSFEIDGKTHTLQGIRDDCPQMDNKQLAVIKWCQEKEEDEVGATLDKMDFGMVGHQTLNLKEP